MTRDLDREPGAPPEHFIVLVPGYMGSKLRDKTTGEIVWIDFSNIPINPLQWDDWLENLFEKMAYPNDNLEPAGVLEEILFIPPWAKQEHYGRLFEALEKIGYRTDPGKYPEDQLNVYSFPYDWRQDNRISARQLGKAVDHWRAFHPGAEVWLIGHSNGGIVSRWYIEKEGGKEVVGKMILMGSPWDGAPKAMTMLVDGLGTLFRRRFAFFGIPEKTRELIRSFPSAYHLIPAQNPFLRDENNNVVDPFADTSWLETNQHRAYLEDGRRFNLELGNTPSVETFCFFGRKLPTQNSGVVHFDAGGGWKEIEWFAEEAGDGTIPERSAVHPQADEILPFVVGHGDIYVNPAVLEFLEWEFVGKYRTLGVSFDVVTTPDVSILFEPDKDVYEPGETIRMSGQVLGAEEDDGQRPPIEFADFQFQLDWQGPLPGDTAPESRPELQSGELKPMEQPGEYSGKITAPEQEGYYELSAVVSGFGLDPIRLSEIVLVERE